MKLHYLSCASLLLAVMFSLVSCGSGSDKFENYDLIPVRTSSDGKWSMVNSKGEIVYDGEFKNQPSVSYNGLFAVEGEEGYTVFSSADSKSPKEVKGLSNLK